MFLLVDLHIVLFRSRRLMGLLHRLDQNSRIMAWIFGHGQSMSITIYRLSIYSVRAPSLQVLFTWWFYVQLYPSISHTCAAVAIPLGDVGAASSGIGLGSGWRSPILLTENTGSVLVSSPGLCSRDLHFHLFYVFCRRLFPMSQIGPLSMKWVHLAFPVFPLLIRFVTCATIPFLTKWSQFVIKSICL